VQWQPRCRCRRRSRWGDPHFRRRRRRRTTQGGAERGLKKIESEQKLKATDAPDVSARERQATFTLKLSAVWITVKLNLCTGLKKVWLTDSLPGQNKGKAIKMIRDKGRQVLLGG
jgi:hypothetical protein